MSRPIVIIIACVLIGVTHLHAAENLLLNGSMEAWRDTGIRPLQWGAWTNERLYHSFQVSRDSEIRKEGKCSMKVVLQQGCNIYQSYPVKPGKTYTLSAWVYPDQATTVKVKFSKIYTPEMKKKLGTIREVPESFTLRPEAWQRVSITETMPEGVVRATLYFCFSTKEGPLTINLDAAMLNEGEIAEYRKGMEFAQLYAFGRQYDSDVKMFPKSYDAEGNDLREPDIGWLFDRDIMSRSRLTQPNDQLPKFVGAEFEKPVRVSGVYVLLHDKGILEKMSVTVSVFRETEWREVESELMHVGPTCLFRIEPQVVSKARVNLIAKDGRDKVKCPKIYSLGFAQ